MSILEEINYAPERENDEDRYRVSLPEFYGPLDLLLALIEREELEITEISLAQITDQYLAYVTALKEVTPDNLTDFLVVASRLILLKSQMLLPQPPPGLMEEEEAETDDLVQQLRAYKRFKELAQALYALERAGGHSFVRLAPPPKIEARLKPGEANLPDLLAAARRALAIKPAQPAVDAVVSPQVITIGQQIRLIRQRLRDCPQLQFEVLLTEALSRVEVIVTFLAILELLKHRLIDIRQPSHFGSITIVRLATSPLTEADWAALEKLTEVS
jgi:segregation and condensation protein A